MTGFDVAVQFQPIFLQDGVDPGSDIRVLGMMTPDSPNRKKAVFVQGYFGVQRGFIRKDGSSRNYVKLGLLR